MTGEFHIHYGDSFSLLARHVEDNSIDSMVVDPPYGLNDRPIDLRAVHRAWDRGLEHQVAGGGFMGCQWDAFVLGPSYWVEAFRVLKPGAHAVVFAGDRTVHLAMDALIYAGFEVRFVGSWLYYNGNTHGRDIGKYDLPDWQGWRTRIKSSFEPWIVVQKPIAERTIAKQVAATGTGALNFDACSFHYMDPAWPGNLRSKRGRLKKQLGSRKGNRDALMYAAPRTNSRRVDSPIKGKYGPSEPGLTRLQAAGRRVPASTYYCPKPSTKERERGTDGLPVWSAESLVKREAGSAGMSDGRAGAGRKARGRRNCHPTVKPVELLRWLWRLVTPPGGTGIDPCCGSGSGVVAGVLEGFDVVGGELNANYWRVAESRAQHAQLNPALWADTLPGQRAPTARPSQQVDGEDAVADLPLFRQGGN